MSTAILEHFLVNFVEATGGIAEQIEQGTYSILYGSDSALKTITFDIEEATENPQAELFLPGSSFFDTVVRDAITKGRMCSTYLSGFQIVPKIIQSEATKVFSFSEHKKDGVRRLEPQLSPFQPHMLKTWTFTFQTRITTDIIEENLYTISIDARTLRVLKNFTELLDKFQHLRRCEEDMPEYQMQDFAECYKIAFDGIKQKLASLITKKNHEVTFLKTREAGRIKKYYETLLQETEELLEKKANDKEAVIDIQAKQKAMEVQRQAALNDIEFRYKMDVNLSLVSVLVTHYPCYIAKAQLPSSQPQEFDLLWNPLFKRFEPLICPTCKNHSYALNILRSGIVCQLCMTVVNGKKLGK